MPLVMLATRQRSIFSLSTFASLAAPLGAAGNLLFNSSRCINHDDLTVGLCQMLLAAIEKKCPPAAHVRFLGNLSRVTETMTILCAARALRSVFGSRGLLNSHAAM